MAPAVARARAAGIDARGPFPPDSVFFRAAAGEFDAVVALYHDQGLIPVKLLDAVLGDSAVNVTLGLPFVRTSPDHGVAWDLAGNGPGQRPEHAGGAAAGRRRSRAAAGARRPSGDAAPRPAPPDGRPFGGSGSGSCSGSCSFTAAWGATTSYRRRVARALGAAAPGRPGAPLPEGDVDAEAWRPGSLAPLRPPRRGDGALAGSGRVAFEISVVGPVRWSGALPFSPPPSRPVRPGLARHRRLADHPRHRPGRRRSRGGLRHPGLRPVPRRCTATGVGFAEGSGARERRGGLRPRLLRRGPLHLRCRPSATSCSTPSAPPTSTTGRATPASRTAWPIPDRVPRYPQDHAEWMVGEVAARSGARAVARVARRAPGRGDDGAGDRVDPVVGRPLAPSPREGVVPPAPGRASSCGAGPRG